MVREVRNDCTEFTEKDGGVILVGEANTIEASRLLRSLALLGYRVLLATSAEQVLGMIRRHVLMQAVVATELTFDGEPILARLARLPSMKRLIATGPAGNSEIEMRGRLCGADLYLPRPVTIEGLAKALQGLISHRLT